MRHKQHGRNNIAFGVWLSLARAPGLGPGGRRLDVYKRQLHMLPEIQEELEDGRLQNAALSSFPYSLYFKTVRSVITEYGEELL